MEAEMKLADHVMGKRWQQEVDDGYWVMQHGGGGDRSATGTEFFLSSDI